MFLIENIVVARTFPPEKEKLCALRDIVMNS